jgi:hypothetical protein
MLTAIETTATIGANRQLTLEKDWVKAASQNDAFDFMNHDAEGIYTLKDGKPLTDEI